MYSQYYIGVNCFFSLKYYPIAGKNMAFFLMPHYIGEEACRRICLNPAFRRCINRFAGQHIPRRTHRARMSNSRRLPDGKNFKFRGKLYIFVAKHFIFLL
jgi:hypothetical protein